LRRASNDEIHPYTLQLRDSQRRRANGSGIDLAAHTHKLARAATGCPYHARCELRPKLSAALQKKCSTDVPGEVAVGDQHALACWGIGR
jgi:ABC-type dipeptide/oligopeptide/nickel transport system ATPase component